jgi:hypothetical protein
MNLRLLEMRYNNIREMDDLTIPLTISENQPYKNTLVQMPNGTGKTTTMKLIRYALDGTATHADIDDIKSFKPLFATSETKGEFEIKLLLDGEIIFVTILFDYEAGDAKYFTTSTRLGGKTPGLNLGAEANSILSPSFVKLFIFDGEVASAIKDIRRNEAENAIKTLFYLDKISTLKSIIGQLVEKRQSGTENTDVRTNQGIKSLQTHLKKAKNELICLIQQDTELETVIIENRKSIEDVEKKLDELGQQDERLTEAINTANGRIKDLENQIESNAKTILITARDPITLNNIIEDRLKHLGTLMTDMRLPRTTSKEFFDLLVEQGECLCGRPMEEKHKKIIQEKVKDFLTEDQIGVINALKQTLRSIPESSKKMKEYIDIAYDIQRSIQEENTARDRLIAQRDEYIDPELREKLNNTKQDCSNNIRDAEEQLRLLKLEDESELRSYGITWQENLFLCNKHIGELEKKLGEATGTVEFSNKGDILQHLIEEIIRKSLIGLKNEIKEQTNDKISKILPQDGLVIEDISSSVIIQSRGDVSEGQKLSIAYSFLSSLFEQSFHNLPFIVDSPAISIDLSVRREVSVLIPPLFEQFVVFVISSERKNFGETFYDRKDTQLLTIYKDKTKPGKMQINNSEDFFDSFQSEPDEGSVNN